MSKKDEALRAAVEALEANTARLAWSGRCVAYISGYESGFESAKEDVLSLLRSALEEGEEPDKIAAGVRVDGEPNNG